jgi:hypothetical protein
MRAESSPVPRQNEGGSPGSLPVDPPGKAIVKGSVEWLPLVELESHIVVLSFRKRLDAPCEGTAVSEMVVTTSPTNCLSVEDKCRLYRHRSVTHRNLNFGNSIDLMYPNSSLDRPGVSIAREWTVPVSFTKVKCQMVGRIFKPRG